MIPDRTVRCVSVLQLQCRLVGSRAEFLVCLRLCTGRRVDLFQLTDGKRRLLRILSGIGLVKIGKLRLSVAEFLNDQAHLKSPVSQMNVADHLMSQETSHPLNALADHSRTEMAHVQRLCHIGSAVIHNDRERRFCLFTAAVVSLSHVIHVGCQISGFQFYINETRHHGVYF